MWAPLGFLLFQSIDRDIGRIVARATPGKDQVRPEYYAREKVLLDFAWGEFFESCSSLSVCSPSGIILRISRNVGERIREPLLQGGFSKAWVFVNGETGIVSTAGVLDRAKKAKELLAMHMEGLDPEMAYPESLNEYQWSCLCLASAAADYVPAFSNFDGWSICCNEADCPEALLAHFPDQFSGLTFDDWEDMFEFVPSMQSPDFRSGKAGRPAKQPEVLAAYKSVYPEGHKGTPWKSVLLSIASVTGVTCGVDTLRRAIASEADVNQSRNT
jgi:hypothetical protein